MAMNKAIKVAIWAAVGVLTSIVLMRTMGLIRSEPVMEPKEDEHAQNALALWRKLNHLQGICL